MASLLDLREKLQGIFNGVGNAFVNDPVVRQFQALPQAVQQRLPTLKAGGMAYNALNNISKGLGQMTTLPQQFQAIGQIGRENYNNMTPIPTPKLGGLAYRGLQEPANFQEFTLNPFISSVYNNIFTKGIGNVGAGIGSGNPLQTAGGLGRIAAGAAELHAFTSPANLARTGMIAAPLGGLIGGGAAFLGGENIGEGAKRGAYGALARTPGIAGIGQFTNPLQDYAATTVASRFANPILGRAAAMGVGGLSSIPEGIAMNTANDEGYSKSDAVLDFLTGALAQYKGKLTKAERKQIADGLRQAFVNQGGFIGGSNPVALKYKGMNLNEIAQQKAETAGFKPLGGMKADYRGSGQLSIEELINKGDIEGAKRVATSLPENDPYRQSMLSLLNTIKQSSPATQVKEGVFEPVQQILNNESGKINLGAKVDTNNILPATTGKGQSLKLSEPTSGASLLKASQTPEMGSKLRLKMVQPQLGEPGAPGTSSNGNIDQLFTGIKGKIDKIYTESLDRFHPLSVIGKQAGQDQAMRNALTGYYGTGSIGKYHTDFELSPILKSVDSNDLRDYVVAQRDLELSGRGIQGVKQGQSQKVLAALKNKYGGDLSTIDAAATKLYDYQSKLVKEYLVDTGIISKEGFRSMLANNQKYVPFKRVMDTVDGFLGTTPSSRGVGSVGSQGIIKKIKGSDRDIIDPLQGIIENTYKIIGLGQRQKVAKTIVSLKNDLPPGLIKPFRGEVGTRPAISVFESGKVQKYLVPPEVADAAKGLSEEGLSTIVKILSGPTRVFRATATGANPEFAIPNTARDLQSAFVNIGLNPFKFVSGLAHYMKKDDVYQEFLKSGGQTSRISLDRPFLEQSVQDLTGAKSKGLSVMNPKRLYSVLEAVGQASEQPTRIAAFEKGFNQALKQGLSVDEARARGAYSAQESTVNFARRGSKTQSINAIYAFLNARAQGVDRLVRSFKSDPAGVSTRIGLITIAPALALYAHNRGFQSFYDDRVVPPYEKENNFIFMLSDTPIASLGGAQYIKIPKGDIGKVANPIETFVQYAEGKGGDVQASLSSVLKAFSPVSNIGDIIPTTLRPPVEVAANKNFFTGFPIVPDSKKDYPAQYQYTKSTAPIYKEIGARIKQSPAKIEHLTRGYLTGFARLGEMAAGKVSKGDNYSGEDINRTPILRRFLGGAVRSEEEQQLSDLFKQKGLERQIQDIKTGVKHGDIPIDAGINEINRLLNTNQPQLPVQRESFIGVKEASAAETNQSPQDKIRAEVEEYKAKNAVELTGGSQVANGKLFYRNENGNAASVDLNMEVKQPVLTGETELDKKLTSKYKGAITAKTNDIVKLYELGYLSKDQAEEEIKKLKQSAGTGRARKPKKVTIKGVTVRSPRVTVRKARPRLATFKLKKSPSFKLSAAKKTATPTFRVGKIRNTLTA